MFNSNSTIGWVLGRLTATARELFIFLRNPVLPEERSKNVAPKTDLLWLFFVNCLGVALIAAVIFPMMVIFEIEMSNNMAAMFDRPVWQIMLIVVMVGPIVEELMFRSWLSGLPKLLVPLGGLIAFMAGKYILDSIGIRLDSILAITLIAMFAVLIVTGLFRFWKRPTPGWYSRLFPIIFWLQATLFGLVHIFNYAGENPVTLLPFILPQLLGGLIWGYARIRYGWWANIAMHMAYNLLATSGIVYVLITQPNAI